MANYGGYCFFTPQDALVRLQVDVQARLLELRARGETAGANRILDAYVTLRDGLQALAVKTAIRGSEILREHERQTRVRPPTEGLGGARLEDNLQCDPLELVGIHGAVGVANYDLLDSNVPWWWTQEEGYRGNVGRLVFGAFFEPGPETRPSRALDRQHAIFEPRGDSASRHEAAALSGGEAGKRGSMVIEKPIAARRFLRSAAHVIEAEWLAQANVLIDAFITEVAAVP